MSEFFDNRHKLNISEAAEVFVFPASFAQQRLWFLAQLAPNNPFYNVTTALRLTGVLNHDCLEGALDQIVGRHEVLRTTFAAVDGQPIQVISPNLKFVLNISDLQKIPAEKRETESMKLAELEAEQPFDLLTGPLLRGVLICLSETEHILLINMHHIVADDWSLGVLIRELGIIYTALVDGRSSELPELPLQYADFSEWQRECLQGEVLESQLVYWRQQLTGIQALNLPIARPKLAAQSYRGATEFFELPPQLSSELKALSQQEGATLFMTLLAAFQVLLYRYSQQEDLAIGTPIANRNRSEIEGLIGFFVNTLVLRTDLSGNPTFRELLSRVREVTMSAYARQDVPFEQLVEELQPERSLHQNPLFQVVFSLQNAPSQQLELPGLELSYVNLEVKTARFDLELHLWDAADSFRGFYGKDWQYSDSFRGVAIYNTDLFDRNAISRMLEHFKILLLNIVANPEQRIANLPLLSEAERHRLLIEGNNTRRDYPRNRCVHELFEEIAEQNSSAIALTFSGQQFTYRELNDRSNQLAHYLQKLGVGAGVLVGLCAARSRDTIIGMLGILKAGGAYLPLDPSYPRDRLNFMLADAGVNVLLVQSKLAENFTGFEGAIVCLDDLEIFAKESIENLTNTAKSDNLAYIIYTSGSTGKPKGVAVPHKAINRLVINTNYIKILPSDKVAQVSNTSFDAATFEIWGALLNGAQLVVINTETMLSPRELASEIRQQGITILFLTTALFQKTAGSVPQAFNSLKYLLFGGEVADPKCVREVLQKGPPEHLIHVYGPTENTTFSAFYCVGDVPEQAASVPIGKPIANTQIYILDNYLQPVPIGIPGELHVGGDGLAEGYLNRPDLTAEKFIPNPFTANSELGELRDAKLYKTGDLARYLPDGNIEFLGRIDSQVKIRGYRIELGEIEAMLNQYPGVKAATVIVREDIPGDKYLAAYIVLHSINYKLQVNQLQSGNLRQFLQQKLPGYMVPKTLAVLESLPLTPNGKVDRAVLLKIDAETGDRQENYVAPRTEVEEVLAQIWAKVLGKQQVSVCDNFFELGGHSLLATQLISRIRDAFQIELSVRNLFESPTTASLAKYIETVCWAAKNQQVSQQTVDAREDVEF
ncbi:amino acid adenylation domain-containing protein [Kamptonema animale CS-326]|jgi:amino acid adenylation domain-containing protein|uniref:non-ribosomal peptide synthetase n=1 Tax=Kamptonema animale TaxID=92934 RepID=UPI00232EE43A|nr:amino acid adenylation domain-containing protein [Kamptonema animale]MDB9513950.1 amino acid adenylation domain-containing protein [Kamptonema animale CS-326]